MTMHDTTLTRGTLRRLLWDLHELFRALPRSTAFDRAKTYAAAEQIFNSRDFDRTARGDDIVALLRMVEDVSGLMSDLLKAEH